LFEYSGGGLRASFIHLGLLARLAECDILRSVEAISCVSGGSIVGAHYYLLMQQLLETKRDEEITKQDLIDLVHTLIKQFRDGTQR
jgi:predicted acylesterase/phospholipase RssA